MTKFISLLTAARVGGVLRHPHEGARHVENSEADRLIADNVAIDVSADFTEEQHRNTPVEKIIAETPTPGDVGDAAPHQSEVAPQEADEKDDKPRARKGAASKE